MWVAGGKSKLRRCRAGAIPISFEGKVPGTADMEFPGFPVGFSANSLWTLLSLAILEADECPREAPDLSRLGVALPQLLPRTPMVLRHHSLMAEVLSADPTIYARLKARPNPEAFGFG